MEELVAFEGAAVSVGGGGLEDTCAEEALVVELRTLRRDLNACTGPETIQRLEQLEQRSVELAASKDPEGFSCQRLACVFRATRVDEEIRETPK